jgi:hypothetical protein
MRIKFWFENLKGRDHSEDLWMGDNIKMEGREIGFGGVDWIYLAQYRDRWRVLMNTVINHRVL